MRLNYFSGLLENNLFRSLFGIIFNNVVRIFSATVVLKEDILCDDRIAGLNRCPPGF